MNVRSFGMENGRLAFRTGSLRYSQLRRALSADSPSSSPFPRDMLVLSKLSWKDATAASEVRIPCHV